MDKQCFKISLRKNGVTQHVTALAFKTGLDPSRLSKIMNHVQENKNLNAAQRYAKMGWPVFPVHSVKADGSCSCANQECASVGKHPQTKNGLKDATTEKIKNQAWWEAQPNSNIGVVTGRTSNLLVLDVDPRHNGYQSLDRLVKKNSRLPETVTSITGGGGFHYFFKYPQDKLIKNKTSFLPGLDIRGEGGYVVVPPSSHKSGHMYEWEHSPDDVPLTDAPEWLFDEIADKPTKNLGEIRPQTIFEGNRNTKLFSYARSLRAKGLEQEAIMLQLRVFNEKFCLPPLSATEVEQIASSASKYPVGNQKKTTQKTDLLLLTEDIEFFYTPDKQCYGSIKLQGHTETHNLKSKFFRLHLARLYYQFTKTGVSSQNINDALTTLEGKALCEGPETQVFTRIAGDDQKIYLDLGNKDWKTVEIDGSGWRIQSDAPVKFRRSNGMLPLPFPESSQDLNAFRELVNLPDNNAWVLALSWLISCFRPNGPYAVLILLGEQGCAKSTLARMLKSLIDPSTCPLRTLPRTERDLCISAANSWLLVYDNISNITPDISDSLCRLSTGGGLGTRELYTDREEILFNVKRPILLNGINDPTTRPDLTDRSLVLTLPVISEELRVSEEALWNKFEKIKTGIMGTLLNAVSVAITRLPNIHLDKKPRMIDFALWASAAETALGFNEGSFINAYEANILGSVETIADASLIAQPIREIAENDPWEGTAAQLLEALSGRVSEDSKKSYHWPKTPNLLSNQLRRLAPTLRKVGFEVQLGIRESGSGKRLIRLYKTHRPSSQLSSSSQGQVCDGSDDDLHTNESEEVSGAPF